MEFDVHILQKGQFFHALSYSFYSGIFHGSASKKIQSGIFQLKLCTHKNQVEGFLSRLVSSNLRQKFGVLHRLFLLNYSSLFYEERDYFLLTTIDLQDFHFVWTSHGRSQSFKVLWAIRIANHCNQLWCILST